MEWLGILLLYLISGYMKKRNQDAKRQDIESDPDWDMPKDPTGEDPHPPLDSMLSDLFGQEYKVERSEIFEENIYHSSLANRLVLHFGKKWAEKNALRSDLFDSNKSLKKAIILKEVLDKPLTLRK